MDEVKDINNNAPIEQQNIGDNNINTIINQYPPVPSVLPEARLDGTIPTQWLLHWTRNITDRIARQLHQGPHSSAHTRTGHQWIRWHW